MKIWHISDTHGMHDYLEVPRDVDMVVHSGDSTNYKDLVNNNKEYVYFLEWFIKLPIKYKILIAGNHDAWATQKYNTKYLKDNDIIFLNHEYIEIEDVNIFGSPWTPTFGDWYFMRDRAKMYKTWSALEKGIDVLVTHGPPYGILDTTSNRDNIIEIVGDKSLLKKVIETQPKVHLFGHVHNCKNVINYGVRQIGETSTLFYNSSLVTDGRLDMGLHSNGHIIRI